jgi:hypothetical protein
LKSGTWNEGIKIAFKNLLIKCNGGSSINGNKIITKSFGMGNLELAFYIHISLMTLQIKTAKRGFTANVKTLKLSGIN